MAIRNNLTIDGSDKVSLRFLMQPGFNSNRVVNEEESQYAH